MVLRSRKTGGRNGITGRVLSGVQYTGAGANRMARLAGFPKKQTPGVMPRIGRRGDGDLKVVVVSSGKDALSAGAVCAERRDETCSGRSREQEGHESRVVSGASVTRIGSLRSRVPGNWHARFWSRAAGATPSLRLPRLGTAARGPGPRPQSARAWRERTPGVQLASQADVAYVAGDAREGGP